LSSGALVASNICWTLANPSAGVSFFRLASAAATSSCRSTVISFDSASTWMIFAE
jgi:hypothetical protein